MKKLVLFLILISFITVEAKGEDYISYKVTFNDEGRLTVFDVKENDPVGKIKDPVKNGYKFIGWYKNNTLYDFNKPVTESFELISKYEKIEETIQEEKESNNLPLLIPSLIVVIGIPTIFFIYKLTKGD